MGLKTNIGLITLLIAAVSYSFYYRDIFRRKTKPHAISWLIWALLNGIIFFTQNLHGAGAGGWVTGFAAIMSFSIFITSLRYGEKSIHWLDWLCLVGALVILGELALTNSAQGAVFLASAVFIIGFLPTIRKSLKKPRQETGITFFLNGTKFLLAIAALEKYSFITAAYPVVVAAMNLGFVGLLVIRRRS